MAAGSIAAGLVDGYVRGLGLRRQMDRDEEDRKDREEERTDRAATRARLRQQQADEDALNEALRGVKRGVSSYGPSPEDSDMYGPTAGELRQVPRSQRDILADQARAVAGVGGLRGAQLGLQFQQGVDQLDEVQRQRRRQDAADERQAGIDRENATDIAARRAREAIADRQMRVLEGMRNARILASTAGNDPQRLASVAQAMSAIYEGVPDGRKLVVNNGTMTLVGGDGKPFYDPVPITAENIRGALDYAERYLDPNWAQRRKLEIEQQQADDNRAYRDLVGRVAKGELDAKIAGGYFNQRAGGSSGESARTHKHEDGTVTVLGGRDGNPQYNILANGQRVRLGLTETMWQAAQRQAKQAGVEVDVIRVDNVDQIGFKGRDGKWYTTAERAANARPAAPR